MTTIRFFALIAFFFSTVTVAKTPVIYDTDIGSDIDDTWALSLILKNPQLDLKLVTTATENTRYRAKVAAKFLQVAGRSDIPVGIGVGGNETASFQKPWVEGYSLNDYPGDIAQDGVARLINTIRASAEPVTLIVAGPMHNIQEALKRAPDIAGKTHLVGMHGSVYKGYQDEPSAEYNVANNVPAFRAALNAPWLSFTITPLDTCGDIIITGDAFAKLKASKDRQLQAIFDNYDIWAKLVTWEKPDYIEYRTSVLYDAVAIYLALPEHDFVNTTEMGMTVDDEGFLHPSEEGPKINVALTWNNKPAFYDWLNKRLLSQ